MVKFKIIDNRTSISRKIREQEEKLLNYRKYFLQEAADTVVLSSPVDTGTYITSHQIVSGRAGEGAYTSSHGKPRNQPYSPKANEALSNLYSDIEALSDSLNLSSISIRNIALHANDVEYKHGHAPYTTLRDKASLLASRAAQRAKA